MIFLRKYATGTGADVIIPIIKRGVIDFAVTADWTPAAADVKISKDGGVAANITTLPVILTDIGWKFVFSDAELTAARINVNIVDAATKTIEDQHIVIETYGNASAQHAFDLDTAGLTAAQVNTEVLDVLNVDTFAEPGQGAPAATASIVAKIGYLYKQWRNRKAQTASTRSLYNDDAVTVDQKSTVSDDGTTYGDTEVATGP